MINDFKVEVPRPAPIVDHNAALRLKLDTLGPTKQIVKPEKKQKPVEKKPTSGKKRGRPKKQG